MWDAFVHGEWDATAFQEVATAELRGALYSKTPIALYGAGQTGRLIARALQGEVRAFIDTTPEKIGLLIDGIPVLSPGQAHAKYGQGLFVIVCVFSAKHRFVDTMEYLGAQYNWKACAFPQAMFLKSAGLPYLYLDVIPSQVASHSRYVKLHDRLSDERSRAVLVEHLRARLFSDFSGAVDARTDVDFLGLSADMSLTYVDGGAFDGDTVQDFIDWRGDGFRKIVALEPDPDNFSKLQNRISRLPVSYQDRIELRQEAIWAKKGRVPFCSGLSVGSAIAKDGDGLASSVTLDMFSDLPDPILIKLDIEGAELESIISARDFVCEKKPFMAISAYHRPNDLLELFETIDSFSVGYEFMLRCHGGDGTDLTLYCVPTRM